MAFNWDEEEKNAGGNENFLEYAPNGEYKVKLDEVEVKDSPQWKSPMVVFSWQDGEYKYQKSVAHWLSMGNPSFRRVHMRNILMEFGASKENAQKLIEQADADGTRDKIVKGYRAMFNRLAQKQGEVRIVVRSQMRDGKPVLSSNGTVFGESDFANRKLQLGGGNSKPAPSAETLADSFFGGEEVAITEDEIPFN